MNTNRRSQKRPWIIAGLLVLALLSTAISGCKKSTVSRSGNSTTSGTVNSTLVDVNGLLAAPTKVATSYPTEELSLGYDSCAGMPQLLDGTLYTFTYQSRTDGYQDTWTTAWDQTTGKKLWSVCANADAFTDTTFHSDGKYLFYISAVLGFNDKISATVASRSVACLNKETGATLWENVITVASPFIFGLNSNIAMHINQQNNTVDRVYVLGEEVEQLPAPPEGKIGSVTISPDVTPKVRNPGIYIFDGANGKLLGRINWPALSTLSGNGGKLLCDGTTLYATIPESTRSEYPAQKSSLVAFDLTTNKILWQEGVDGEGTHLVKQGNVLTFVRTVEYSGRWIDVWQISTDGATRLWTRQAEGTPEEGPRTSFAVDSSRIYLQGSKGIFRALDLTSGKEVWKHQFAPTKGPITDGPDVGKLHDTYPGMALMTTRNALYVQNGGGLVAVFDPKTGKELWSKQISNLQIGQTHASGMYVLQFVDNGFFVIASDGKVDLWK